MIKVNAYVCPKCGDKVFSRAHHDYRNCTCGEIAVDGGFEYTRIAFKDVSPQSIELEIDATKKDLYFDWNSTTDMFGIIKKDGRQYIPKKHVIDKDKSGNFSEWDIGNIKIEEFIEELNKLKKQNTNREIRLDLEYDNNLQISKLIYTVWRLETDEEFEKRKKLIEKNKTTQKIKEAEKARKKAEREEKRLKEQFEKDKKKFQELKDKYDWK